MDIRIARLYTLVSLLNITSSTSVHDWVHIPGRHDKHVSFRLIRIYGLIPVNWLRRYNIIPVRYLTPQYAEIREIGSSK